MESSERKPSLHGCRSTHIYCLPTCRYDRRVLERNRVTFASAEEAVRAGYRACKVCKPPPPGLSAEV